MLMSGLEFMGEVPFDTVYLHGTVRDTQHRKMSKSLGNGIDPLEVVERYGADALRYTVVAGMAVGTDLILDPSDLESSFAAGRNFANKLWNAGRFILGNLDGPTRPLAGDYRNVVPKSALGLADRWIIARCDATIRTATEAYERYRLNDAANAIYHFIWSDLADWYIEQIKPRLYGDVPGKDVAQAVVAATFETALRMLHPVMPFITEALWQRLPGRGGASISVAPWPGPDQRASDPAALAQFGLVQELVGALRSIRADYGIQPGLSIRAFITDAPLAGARIFDAERPTIMRLAKLSGLELGNLPEGAGATAVLSDGSAVFVPLGDAIDLDKECGRLKSEHSRLVQQIQSQNGKLANEQFVARAPAEVVDKERRKLDDWREQADVLSQKLERLGCK
jgi:valyl-tRNA synthetase